MNSERMNQEIKQLPPNFKTIILDWTKDLSTTFPEYAYLWTKWTNPDISEVEIRGLYDYCMTVYPERFFDILYQNADLFDSSKSASINTCFLPDVEFKLLFNCSGISETTCKTMWNYLQLVLFTIVGSIHDKSKFGESANMFEGLGEDELHTKLHDAMSSMSEFFQNMSDSAASPSTEQSTEQDAFSANFEQFMGQTESTNGQPPTSTHEQSTMPDVDDLHGHLKGLFNGKIGNLAKEMAEEISGEMADILGKDGENIKSSADVLKNMMKNPAKITGLIKTVSDKLQQKMNSGEISKEELMREATEILGKMKGQGGGAGDFQEMFKNMAKGMGMNIPKNAKMDMNALDRMTKQSTMRDRMQGKMAEKKAKDEADQIARQQAFAQQVANYKPYDFSTDTTPKKKLVFKIDGEEKPQTSSAKPLTNQLLLNHTVSAVSVEASSQATGPNIETNPESNSGSNSGKKKKKKSKK